MNEQVSIHDLLEKHFGFRQFLEGQEAAIEAVLDGQDALVVMPTGGGKSLCYQLPALALDGITIVVSPLIALMKDQVDGLIAKNIPATFINSSLSDKEISSRISQMACGKVRLVYVAPERFKSRLFLETLAPLSIALFAIDEAHCISQWGHDFRPDYLRLKKVLSELGRPQVMALTATATPEVRADIAEQLALGQHGREQPGIFVSGFARRNLTLTVTRVKNRAAKLSRIVKTLRELKTGIIYCSTRKNVERVSADVVAAGFQCVSYHGGLTEIQRSKAQDKFMSGGCPVAVATNAFGMGIDRADLRFVTHYDIPGSVEAYYQEAGRAGRDGEPSRCELLFNYADVKTQEFFIEGANPKREVIGELYAVLSNLCAKEPVTLSITDIAEHVLSARNDMAIGTALHLLERAHFIHREYAQGERTYTTQMVQPRKPLEELGIDFDTLDAKLQRDMAKLRRMIDYPDFRGCRHYFILNYFGDETATPTCTVCDNCVSHTTGDMRLPTDEETVIIQKALSCVGRMNGRFGRGRITQTLVGSRSKEIIEMGLDQLSTYGLLADEGTDYVWSLIEALIQAGCIEVCPGNYPTLSLTPLGHDVVRRRKSIPLVMPNRGPEKAKPASRGERRKARKSAGHDYNVQLFDALRKWRMYKAASMGNVPAYLIYPDATLEELARAMPQTTDALLEVKGIGPAKAHKFGRDTLEVIKSFTA